MGRTAPMDDDSIFTGLLIALLTCVVIVAVSVTVAWAVNHNRQYSYKIIVDDNGSACVR